MKHANNSGGAACGRAGLRAVATATALVFLVGCESTPRASVPPPLVAQVQAVSEPGAQDTGEVWDGRGATKVEFGRVIQSTPVVIDGRETGAGKIGGGLVGAVATVPKKATTGAIVTSAAGTIGGAIVGGKFEEIMTRRKGQEILVRLEEGKVVTITQDAEGGYFQEGDVVKVVHREEGKGAHVSLTNPDERAAIQRTQAKIRGEGAWYEHADGSR